MSRGNLERAVDRACAEATALRKTVRAQRVQIAALEDALRNLRGSPDAPNTAHNAEVRHE